MLLYAFKLRICGRSVCEAQSGKPTVDPTHSIERGISIFVIAARALHRPKHPAGCCTRSGTGFAIALVVHRWCWRCCRAVSEEERMIILAQRKPSARVFV
jgi:hypothetical protein